MPTINRFYWMLVNSPEYSVPHLTSWPVSKLNVHSWAPHGSLFWSPLFFSSALVPSHHFKMIFQRTLSSLILTHLVWINSPSSKAKPGEGGHAAEYSGRKGACSEPESKPDQSHMWQIMTWCIGPEAEILPSPQRPSRCWWCSPLVCYVSVARASWLW